jgi:predicted Fe-Mo cluster-binding NifX family protein
MGQKARDLFEEKGVKVCRGHGRRAEAQVADYLRGSLATGPNTCDH